MLFLILQLSSFLLTFFKIQDVNNCNLPSDKYYENLESVTEEESSKSYCDSNNNILDNYPNLKVFCCKLVSHLVNLKNRNSPEDMKKHCTYLLQWLIYKVISTTEIKFPITYMTALHSVWLNIVENLDVSIKNTCSITFSSVSIGYLGKWKKMHDYNNNYVHLKTEFDNKKNCKEYYCKYIVDIFNLYNEFLHVCNGSNKHRCPDFWLYFKKGYEESSELEQQCKDVYDKLGFYKVKMSFEDQDEGTYIEQYVSEHKFY